MTCRGYSPGTTVDGGVTIRVGEPERAVEYLALSTEPAVHRALAKAAAAQAAGWLSAPSFDRPATEAAVAAAGLVPGDPEWVMHRDLADHPIAALPEGYVAHTDERDSVVSATILHADHSRGGTVAAWGQLAIHGQDAVPDRINTVAEHRRRGLGRALMGALVAAAQRRGARTGLLIASVEGRQLYESLGWATAADFVVGRSRPGDRPDGAGDGRPAG